MKKHLQFSVMAALLLLGGISAMVGCTQEQVSPVGKSTVQQANSASPLAAGAACSPCAYLDTAFPKSRLSAEESAALIWMREEEKLARDVYQTLSATANSPVFAQIAKSEQRHMDAVLCLLQKYSLSDPSAGLGMGEFTRTDFNDLYTALVTQGQQSTAAALRVGATIEDLDLKDLQDLMQMADNEDLLAVFGELERGSRNHIRSFTSQLSALGEAYEAQYISSEALDTILSSPREKGGSLCGGTGQGQNQGIGTCPQGNTPGSGQGNNGSCPAGNVPGSGNGNPGPGNGGGNGPGNGNGGNGPGNGGGNGGGNGNGGSGNGGGNG